MAIDLPSRIARHVRITRQAFAGSPVPAPKFLILFINSICNLTCEHCFYWRNLNRRDDLTLEELDALSADLEPMGQIENLNISGGEPFLHPDFADVCHAFIQRNGVRQIYVPTNGFFTDRTLSAIERTLERPELDLFVAEISLDGTPAYHDKFRGSDRSFSNAMETYDALVDLQRSDPRLRIHAISTATSENMEEIHGLTRHLIERCPNMDHHNLAIIRGDRKDPGLQGPQLQAYMDLAADVKKIWEAREEGRYGAIVEPMLQWAKIETARQRRQVVPCTAGRLTAVVYSNGDVSVCENHPPLGNLRDRAFSEIWNCAEADALRASIRARECHCTNEVFLWPSIVFQPTSLVRGLWHAKVTRSVEHGKLSTEPIDSGTSQAGPRPEANPRRTDGEAQARKTTGSG